jgi:Domain of Unknown Function (DUF350)
MLGGLYRRLPWQHSESSHFCLPGYRRFRAGVLDYRQVHTFHLWNQIVKEKNVGLAILLGAMSIGMCIIIAVPSLNSGFPRSSFQADMLGGLYRRLPWKHSQHVGKAPLHVAEKQAPHTEGGGGIDRGQSQIV